MYVKVDSTNRLARGRKEVKFHPNVTIMSPVKKEGGPRWGVGGGLCSCTTPPKFLIEIVGLQHIVLKTSEARQGASPILKSEKRPNIYSVVIQSITRVFIK